MKVILLEVGGQIGQLQLQLTGINPTITPDIFISISLKSLPAAPLSNSS